MCDTLAIPAFGLDMTRSLEELYGAFLATGDEQALEQLMRRSGPTLRSLARRLGANPEDADDLVQETIVAAIQGADRYDPDRPLLPWLKGILTFRAAKLARETVRRRRGYALPGEGDAVATNADPAHAAAGRELDDDVRTAIGKLPAQYQEPLQQYLLAGRSPIEIAQGLGLQRATIRVRLHRGLHRLRELMRRWTSVVLLALFGRTASAGSGVRAAPALAWGALVLVAAGVIASAWPSLRPVPANASPVPVASHAALAPRDEAHSAALRTAAAAPAAVVDATAELVVRVHDGNGAPLAGVGVTIAPAFAADPVLHRRRAVSDAAGLARWSGLERTALRVTTDRSTATVIELQRGANEERVAVASGSALTGRVVDARGEAVADASLWLSSDVEGPWRGDDVARTGADGTFTLPHVPDGAFVAARHAHLARSDVLRVAGAEAIELRLGEPGGAAAVRVLDEAGAPVSDALVFVGDAMDAAPLWLAQGAATWRPPPFEQRTGSDGRATTGALPPGRHPVFVRAIAQAPHAGWIHVARGETNEHVVRLQRGGRLHGRVVGFAGQPMANALAVFRTADPAHSIDVHADEQGRFRFDCVPAGSGDVAVQAPGHLPRLTPIEAVAGGDAELTVVLERVVPVTGTLQGLDTNAMTGCEVRATWAPSALLPQQEVAAVDSDGTFAFTAAGAGAPTLDVRLRGEPLWRAAGTFTAWHGSAASIELPADFAAAGWLEGALRCDGGAPLAGARLFVCRDGVQWAEIGRSDGSGAFRLGPLPAGSYELMAETTARALPTVMVGPLLLARGETVRVDHTAADAGAVDLELTRSDGQAIGDLAITFVDPIRRRRCALASEPKLRQALLPGDYLLYAMGSRVQWLEARPVRVEAGRDTVLRLTLPPATRCALALQGLPRTDAGAPLRFRVLERWQRAWSSTFTLAPDAPLRLAAVLAAGDYVVEHEDDLGASWLGTFSIAGDHDGSRAITVQMATGG